jgi:CheY-like chemotaxis protein
MLLKEERMNQLILAGLTLLVVDDNRDSREMLQVALEGEGAEVIIVGTVQEAIASIQRQPPDLLISDIQMPDESGYHLIAQVRKLELEKGMLLPAIAVTGFARPEDRDACLAAGFCCHLTKPVDLTELVTVIAQSTGRSVSA